MKRLDGAMEAAQKLADAMGEPYMLLSTDRGYRMEAVAFLSTRIGQERHVNDRRIHRYDPAVQLAPVRSR